ncbi:cytochrome P450 [Westerdykella ornata]|uniref:Cytochrome P450 n=1 Tax=Westerdykella ornata TaxID=318751 RepID=A0A6A6J6T4_WESOR|nr:cytochrome P450 [Westerdykella ornata]KAF2272122.1 cytochrome P450 [Westerdykella ornata]
MAIFVVLLSVLSAITLYHCVGRYRSLRRNLAEARNSGLPYVVTPWNVYSTLWLATVAIFLPLLRKLPKRFHGLWLVLLDNEWSHRVGYAPFEALGSDVFLVVSPRKINAYVADAEVITQITTRRADFPKPLRLYKRIDLYGKNVISTEGAAWRMHRRLTAPSFGEKNNELVWNESLHHAQALVKLWAGTEQKGNMTVKEPNQGAMRFALYIISRAGFDVRVQWPHEEKDNPSTQPSEKGSLSRFAGSKPPPGHKMNYRQAISTLLEGIVWTQIGPPSFLTKSPFKVHRDVGTAVQEFGAYMSEMFDAKSAEISRGEEGTPGMDLFQAMLRNSGILDPHQTSDLRKSDLLGNAFVLMVAGHETTANALHFSLLYLAMNPATQKRLQASIDKVLASKPISQWTYEDDFPKLFDGMPAAVMNETLRLTQPIINIPKSTDPGRPQPISMNGKEYLIPGDTHVSLCSAVHRNPKYWPSTPSPFSSSLHYPDGQDPFARKDQDLWRPERWLSPSSSSSSSTSSTSSPPSTATATATDPEDTTNSDDESLRGPTGHFTSSHLFKPPKGAYIPFSDGYRSCIGRRFAQVELLACFAVIFSAWSVELAVDEWASDEVVERMPRGGRERKDVWECAWRRADRALARGLSSIITLQLRGESVPIRLVRRGEERFVLE